MSIGAKMTMPTALRRMAGPSLLALALTVASLSAASALETNTVTVNGGNREYFYHVPANVDTDGFNFIVYALHDNDQTAEQFAAQSGWVELADERGFVVVFPQAPQNPQNQQSRWGLSAAGEDAYLDAVYQSATRNLLLPTAETAAPAGGRQDPAAGGQRRPPTVPTWQPFHYLTGVGAGGTIAQSYAMNHPGIYAAIATLDSAAYDQAYEYAGEPADATLLNQRGGKNPEVVWKQLKGEVPVAAWLFTTGEPDEREGKQAEYWKGVNDVAEAGVTETLGGFETKVYADPANAANAVLTTVIDPAGGFNKQVASAIWDNLFSRTVRWTSTANGELGRILTHDEVDKTFEVRSIEVGDRTYTYYLKAPSNHQPGKELPLVLSAHGASFPAWQYLSQINLHEVGEREGFITVYLQGQGNRWDFSDPNGPDQKFVEAVIAAVDESHGVDNSRVYMQGFSFGSGLTYSMGITHPELFAAVSPNSGIGPMPEPVVAQAAEKSANGLRIPMMIVYGSSDGGSSIDGLIPAKGVLQGAIDEMKAFNGISTADSVQVHQSRNGEPYDILVPGGDLSPAAIDERFPEGRFQDYRYASEDDGLNLFSFVWVPDMPHGGDARQAQYIWDYFKQWSRNPDGTLTHTDE